MDRNRQPVGKQRQYDIGKLGDPYWRDRIPKDYVYFTQDTAACRSVNYRAPARLIGGRELVTANLQSLAKYLDAGKVNVRVWSFFSGYFPYVDTVYQAKQEPEDILDLAAIPSLSELRKARKLQIQDEKLHYRNQDLGSIYNRGAQVYLIDDMPSFEAEMMVRQGYDARTAEALLKLGISFVYAGESKLFNDMNRLVRLHSFEGKRPAYSNRY